MKRLKVAYWLLIRSIIILFFSSKYFHSYLRNNKCFPCNFVYCIMPHFLKIYVEIPGIENNFSSSFFPTQNMLRLNTISAKSETLYSRDPREMK